MCHHDQTIFAKKSSPSLPLSQLATGNKIQPLVYNIIDSSQLPTFEYGHFIVSLTGDRDFHPHSGYNLQRCAMSVPDLSERQSGL